jgi:hypothetical protein
LASQESLGQPLPLSILLRKQIGKKELKPCPQAQNLNRPGKNTHPIMQQTDEVEEKND